MKLNILLLFVTHLFLAQELPPSTCPSDVSDPLLDEICSVKSLIALYTQKLQLLESLQNSSSGGRYSASLPPRNLIQKPSSYAFGCTFLPPQYVISKNSVYDINGRFVGEVKGEVLAVQNQELMVQEGQQLSVVSVKKGAIHHKVWSGEASTRTGIWVTVGKERGLAQYQGTIITIQSQSIKKEIDLNCTILQMFKNLNGLVLVCSERVAKIGLVDFKVKDIPKFHQVGEITSAALEPPHYLYVSNGKNMLYVIDIIKNRLVGNWNFSEAASEYSMMSPALSLAGGLLLAHSASSPTVLVWNTTSTLSLLAPLTICPAESPPYQFSAVHSAHSLYLTCSYNSTCALFELLLPEILPAPFRYVQYGLIVIALGLGVGCRLCLRRREKGRTPAVGKKGAKFVKAVLEEQRENNSRVIESDKPDSFVKELQEMAIKYNKQKAAGELQEEHQKAD